MRRQVLALGSSGAIGLQEHCLDEKDVGVPCQCDDTRNIRISKGTVNDVSDLSP
jgi:hypothetical protein